jgi:hypothetical protein
MNFRFYADKRYAGVETVKRYAETEPIDYGRSIIILLPLPKKRWRNFLKEWRKQIRREFNQLIR